VRQVLAELMLSAKRPFICALALSIAITASVAPRALMLKTKCAISY